MNPGATIRSIRKLNGMKQKDLAKAIGITDCYMNSVELGKEKASLVVIKKVCEHFSVSPTYFMLRAAGYNISQIKSVPKGAYRFIDDSLTQLLDYLTE